MRHALKTVLMFGGVMGGGMACAAPLLMSPDWGAAACSAWNSETELTEGLVESEWVRNDEGKGYKVIQIYRSDCPDSPRTELRIALKGNQARCIYGGKATAATLSSGADYLMHAETKHWLEMGTGEYGPMRAMMFGRLAFDGPMGEAMGNMGPFESFLLLVGKVPADASQCPLRIAGGNDPDSLRAENRRSARKLDTPAASSDQAQLTE